LHTTTLTLTTCQAAIGESVVAAITRYLESRLGVPVRFVNDLPWQERERQFDAGHIDIAWVCGAPYVRKMSDNRAFELLAAPVYAAPRYMNKPIYFSDVIVRCDDSQYQTFSDLGGGRWAYNTAGSHSGYEVVRYHLGCLGLNGNFFNRVICSGAHQRSMEMIAQGEVDASAVDSTVFEAVRMINPALCEALRVIEVLGPSSQPPWVIGTHVPAALRAELRAVLTTMDTDDAGQAVLHIGQLARFAHVSDATYSDIREMIRAADAAGVVL